MIRKKNKAEIVVNDVSNQMYAIRLKDTSSDPLLLKKAFQGWSASQSGVVNWSYNVGVLIEVIIWCFDLEFCSGVVNWSYNLELLIVKL